MVFTLALFLSQGSPLYQYLKEACPDDGFQIFQSTAGADDATLLAGTESNSLTKRLQDAGKFIQVIMGSNSIIMMDK